MSEPKEVTVLKASMMCIGPYEQTRNGQQRGCLMYWRDLDYERHLGHETSSKKYTLYRAECNILRRLIDLQTTDQYDTHLTHAQVAQARNRATALLGYVVGNPEAAWAEKHLAEFQDILGLYKISRTA